MSELELKTAKDALVASLFELSRAAQDAAAATVYFYKANNQEGPAGDSLATLAATLNHINGLSAQALGDSADGKGLRAGKTTLNGSTTRGANKVLGAAGTVDGGLAGTGAGTGSSLDDGSGEGKAGGVTKPEEKKKRKVERDPNAPKKPLTIFFAYSFFTRDKIRQERQKQGLEPLSAAEMNEIIKNHWNDILPEEKAKWQKKYQNELKEYQVLKEAYKAGKPLPSKDDDKSAEAAAAAAAASAVSAAIPPASPLVPKKSKESKKRKSESKKDDLEKGEKSEKSDKESKESKKAKKAKK